MSREIVVSESDKIAVVLENGAVREFFLSEGDQYVGDIILATVESIVPAIEAAFLNIGREKSGFIHVSDLPSSRKQQSGIRQFLKPQQQMLVQVTREPTGNKGACLTGFIQLPGRFLVLTPFERRIGLSKRIYDARERARLARIARMICGSGYGIVLRPEAVGQSEQALRDDLKLLLGRWKHILGQSEKQNAGSTLYRDQDILERILREGATSSISQIIVDGQETYDRAVKYFSNWSDTKASNKLRLYNGQIPALSHYGIYQQLERAIQPLVHLPSGGTLVIQPTEALTSIDVNTASMNSTDNQPETILRTNCEAAEEVAKQLILRDIGGVVVIDFIDMDNPRDQQIVWQKLADSLHHDKAQLQISYFSEFGLVEMTRRRQRQRLSEMLTMPCPTCQGIGRIRNLLYRFDILTGEGMKARMPVIQPEEKSSRFRDGNEKTEKVEKTTRQQKNNSERGSSGRNNKSGGRSSRTPDSVSAPPPEKPREKESSKVSERTKPEEKLEDLLFDDSIFSAEMNNEILERYIEREDTLKVSSRLAGNLDDLIEQIEKDGINSIRRKPDTSKNKKSDPEQEASDPAETSDESKAESTAKVSEDEENTPSEVESENLKTDEAEEDNKGRNKRKGRSKRTATKASSKKAKASDAVASEEASTEESASLTEEAPSTEEKPVKETKAKQGKAKESKAKEAKAKKASSEKAKNADDEQETPAAPEVEVAQAEPEKKESSPKPVAKEEGSLSSLSSANLAESALTASSTSTRSLSNKPKRILTKRRSIRSFRPKR